MSGTPIWSPPSEFDEYRLVRIVGTGGMGQVYLAHDKLLDRPVAIKFISALRPDSRARKQFLVEARAAARLQHPNVVAVYRIGELDDRPYIVSEFVRGRSLSQVEKPIPWQRALEIGMSLSRGLSIAHRRGVLHRDIKPANVLVTEEGEAKLLDFGVAELLGTPGRSPSNEEPSPRSPRDRNETQDALVPSSEPSELASPAREQKQRHAGAPTVETRVTLDRKHPSTDARAETVVAHPAGVGHVMSMGNGSDTALAVLRADSALQSVPRSDLAVTPGLAEDDEDGPPPSHTQSRRIVGTPDYIAPEIWVGMPGTRRADIFSLGALLYELCTGSPPNGDIPTDLLARVIQSRPTRPLLEVAPAIDPRFAALIDRCLRIDPAERFGSGDELRDALEQLLPAAHDQVAIPEGNPYRGLEAFQAEHNALFFGRDAEIRTLTDRLRSEPFVLVAGDSGVGKSSLCRAGVLPRVVRGGIDPSRTWSAATMVPGKRPLTALVAALAPCLGTDEGTLAKEASTGVQGLATEIRRRLGDKAGLMLFLDQFEELVTLSDPEQGALFGQLIAELVSPNPAVRVLATVRGDFLARVALLSDIGEEVGRALYALHPLAKDGMRDAIVGPARAKGFRFESDDFVESLITSTSRSDGGLPLLQFALAELWDARDQAKQIIPASALAAVGGVSGALARHADGVLARLLPAQRVAARRLLVQLVTIDGTRARRSGAELGQERPDVAAALEALVRGRLLVARETDDGVIYEVAHEALLHGWATLRDWLDEQVDSRAVRERLEAAAMDWERLGRARDALWGTRQLAEVALIDPDELGPREAAFVEASRSAVARNRQVKRGVAIGLLLVATLGYGAIRLKARHDLAVQVGALLESAHGAQTEAHAKEAEYDAARRLAFTRFDARAQDAGEEAWSRALALGRQIERSYGRANQELEAALHLDASRKDVKALFGETLFARALLAEREHRGAQVEELLQRLALYDEDGVLRKRWNAPAHLAVQTTPRGAQVLLERYQIDDRQRRHAVKVADLGTTPLEGPALEQGSYRLTLAAPGRVTVRYPLMLARGETLKVSVLLPTQGAVPSGFLYIPAGRSLFGTAADETTRREFMFNVPLHEVQTPAYLVARNETTLAEWIEFLLALPPNERARRTPKIAAQGFRGAVVVSQARGGLWSLAFQPTTRTYSARSDEKIHYEGRRVRAVQDWLRFPVFGISAEDSAAYVAWLSRSGRLPGARLCNEREWERAARGADEREFPHGDRLSPDDANYDETYGKRPMGFGPDEVGSHPASRSPFDADDMAGNVWEWTTSSLSKDQSVARGGSFYHSAATNWTTNRQVAEPSMHDITVGVRVCVSYPLKR